MDKETLSNYGWIVIAVLVLVVMIALAGPFGNFVSEAVQSTTKGLFDVNKNALDAADIPIDNQEFNVPSGNGGVGENGGSGEAPVTPSEPETPTATTVAITIDGTPFQADAGMTWGEWVASDYNTVGYVTRNKDVNSTISTNNVYTTESWCAQVGYNDKAVLLTDTIISGGEYTIGFWGEDEIATLITFTIWYNVPENELTWQAEEGMTWQQWIDSKYNTYNVTTEYEESNGWTYVIFDGTYFTDMSNGVAVRASDVIVANNIYGN